METITRDVGQMKTQERSAAELLGGHALREHERVIVHVLEMPIPASATDARPPQSIDSWMHIYDGLSDEEIDEIDAVINTRANLTRAVPEL